MQIFVGGKVQKIYVKISITEWQDYIVMLLLPSV